MKTKPTTHLRNLLAPSQFAPSKAKLLATACASILLAMSVSGCAKDNDNNTTATNNDNKVENTTSSEAVATTNATTPSSLESNENVVTSLQNNLKASDIDAHIISAVATQAEGIYWVNAEGMPPFFTDATGEHIIQGPIVSLGEEGARDIGADLIANIAKDKLAQINPDEMIIYPAKGETKGVIYAFTDPTCPYCQKLHDELPQINAQGIEVRYLAWPRNQAAEPVVENVWCSNDKQSAFKAAVAENATQSPNCETPVQAHTELGFSLGVQGTPAIFTADGEQIGGYLPPQEIAAAMGITVKQTS